MSFTPMLATDCRDPGRVERFVGDDAWALDQKVDGERKAVVGTAEGLVVVNRRGERADLPAKVTAGLGGLGPGIVLDGELLDGVLWVFDLPQAGALATPSTPLAERREVLEHLFTVWAPGEQVRLLPSAATVEAKAALVESVVTGGGEGFVAKHHQSPYEQGRRSRWWCKVKLTSCADVVITAVSPDGRENYEVSVIDADDPVGTVGWNHRRTGGPCAVGDVIEVEYLYVGAQGRLVQPRVVRRRHDKAATECTADQLRPVNKTIHA
jgi:ATP-dependent DNA ligase